MAQFKLLTRNLIIIVFGFSGLIVNFGSDSSAIAQTEVTEPLAIPERDPLLPPSNIQRELSPLEKKRIRAEIEALEIEANEQLAGQPERAFKLWFRQLRLYRALDLLEEITALGRVGQIAWEANRKEELQVIARRLNELYQHSEEDAIPKSHSGARVVRQAPSSHGGVPSSQIEIISDLEAETQNNFTTEFLTTLGVSYQQVRDLNNAIAVYTTLLARSRQINDLELERKYLETLGELYLDKFDYPQAAIVYQELLAINDENDAGISTENYLLQLIKIYDYTKELEPAIAVKEQLIDYYKTQQNTEPIVDILIALGDDYRALGQVDLAIQAYQEAVIFGQLLQQLASISDALTQLGNLYQEQGQYSLAIQTYNKLLDLEMQADNSYGMVNSYDRLGQVYFILEDYARALSVFTEGLKIARSLDYRISYFTDLINKVKAKNR